MIRPNPRRLGVFVLAAALFPGSARAQASARSFEELQQILKADDIVVVTDDAGKKMKGKVVGLSASSLTLLVGRQAERHVFTVDHTKKIVRQDSLENGILIGLGGGAALAWGWLRAECGPRGYDPECAPSVARIVLPVSVGIGVAVGAVADALIHKTVYVPHQQSSRLMLSPVLGTDRQSVLVSVRF